MKYEVELPPLLHGLGKNQNSLHWAQKGTAVRQYKSSCFYLLKQAKIPAMQKARVSLHFYFHKEGQEYEHKLGGRKKPLYYFPRDVFNAADAFKSGFDAIVLAGILPDDDYKHLEAGEIKIFKGKDNPQKKCCVIVFIEPLEV